MKAKDFVRRIQRLGKRRGIAVVLDRRHGKGSHATLYYGGRKTTVKDRRKEIGPGLLAAMLAQLGLKGNDLSED
jgi:predicted RNA binding protein YcfA (HicA-like mRNA interferase family)